MLFSDKLRNMSAKISELGTVSDYGSVVTGYECMGCGGDYEKLQARGLCMTCYKTHQRAGTLDDYPTTDFWMRPEQYLEWIRVWKPELLE